MNIELWNLVPCEEGEANILHTDKVTLRGRLRFSGLSTMKAWVSPIGFDHITS